MRAEIREGMSALLGHPVLRTLVLCAAVVIFVNSAQLAIFLLYLSRDLGVVPTVIGVLLAMGSVGALGGALLASAVARRIGIGPSFIVGEFLIVGTLITR